ncbi:M1 family metallopeptidase [Altererythrobacter fulvus]|uniref:M1 family metallopeptidase n=1 Tax=Caenibius fulvus TaxID=2126012 RepID=UPI003017EDC3
MRARLLAASFLVSAFACVAQPALAQEKSAELAAVEALGPVPAGRLTDAVVPSAYRLDLAIDPAQETYSGRTQIDVTIARPARYIDLHGLDLTLLSATATIGGKAYAGRWTQLDETGVGRLVFDEQLPAGAALLEFTYSHAFNEGPAGIFRTKVGDQWFAWTQFQSIDARQAFPSFDEPGFKVPFTVTLRTPRGLVAVSNAPEVSTAVDGDWEVHHYAQTKPLPTYLAAFMVGPFAVAEGTIPATPERPSPLAQRLITTPQNAEQSAFALDATAKIIPLLERYFGSPYPYEKLDQITSPIMPGAMENAGAVLYGDGIIMMDEGAPVSAKRVAGMVLAHELGHQWFGDLVTPEWWDDIWLNESFATWIGYYVADQWRPDLRVWEGALGEGFDAMGTDALVVGRPIRQPILTNGQIDAAFDTITYGKGGHVIAMIAAFMGEEKFRNGVRQHLANHAFGNATGDDFFSALAGAAGDPRIVSAMKGFVEQQGVPLVTVKGSQGDYTVSQSRYVRFGSKGPDVQWQVPLCMRRVGSDAERKCELLADKAMPFTLGGDGALLPNAGGTGYYRFELPAEEWDRLIATADTLKGGEAQTLADSLRASFLAGRATPAQLIALARKLSVNPDSYAFGEAGQTLALLDMGGLLEGKSETAFRNLVDGLYAGQLKEIGFDPRRGAHAGEDAEASERRERLVSRLTFQARDAGVRATLLKAARAYLGGDEAALDPAFLPEALDVYIEDGDLARVKDLASRALASQDPVFRPAALGALAERGDRKIADWLLNGFKDERLRPTEKLRLITGVLRREQTREFGAEWLRTNYRDLVQQMGGIFVTRSIPGMLSGFCSAKRAGEFETQFAELVANTPAQLPFERTMEEIRACDALVAARGGAARSALISAK